MIQRLRTFITKTLHGHCIGTYSELSNKFARKHAIEMGILEDQLCDYRVNYAKLDERLNEAQEEIRRLRRRARRKKA